VIAPRDTLWGIAARELGDPFRWPEIFDANRGVPQPDGDTLADPGLIRPGWTLRLPPSDADPAGNGREVVVAPGDSLSRIAARTLGDVARWPDIYQLNRGITQPDGRALLDPNLIQPGWTLTLPAPPPPAAPSPPPTPPPDPVDEPSTPAATTTVPPAPQTTTPTSSPTTTPPPQSEPSAPPVDTEDSPSVPIGAIGAGLAAAGIVLTLDRIRRTRQRQRKPGARALVPDPSHHDLEHQLRADAEAAHGDVDRLDLTLRALGDGLARHRRTPAPQVLAAQLSPERIELLLECPDAKPPPGFEASADGWVWSADTADIDRSRPSADRLSPTPALITVGTTDIGPLLINVEAAGTVEVVGESERVTSTLRHLALELATSAWSDHIDVATIGDDAPPLAGLSRIRRFSTAAEAADELAPQAADRASTLTATGAPSSFAARTSRGATDGWPPLVVIYLDPSTNSDIDRVLGLADGSGALTLVAEGPISGARWTLTCTGDTIEIRPLNLTVDSAARFEADPDQVEALFQEADDTQPAAAWPVIDMATTLPTSEHTESPALFPQPTDAPRPVDDAPSEVEVRVLGPIEIVGSAHNMNGGKPAELITDLAVHPSGLLGDQLKNHLWPPDRPPSPRTFSNTVSAARKLLGAQHFPPARQELYRLKPTVRTDLSRFEDLVRDAAAAPDDKAAELLDQALELVQGEPYTAAHGFHWVQPEGLVMSAQAAVVDAAHRLAELRIANGDPAGADEAARKGLRAEALNEILHRDRMLAADGAGNPAGELTVVLVRRGVRTGHPDDKNSSDVPSATP
jgi:hypothetical protein